ncbi:hypothetical protein SAMN04488118_11725 [Epibacterium ulvae]|uniref:Uncharacterized protein n=1 Tax=Epibacterium ulvae TaxID=1156985 RepID=A0A1G5RJ91_9RHOB|nr:hypothetical protein [Epibacterium ulvae]SCZ73441.1 hypothetical protein SAMN04488118_11725 [Epibacterium ulvae]
MKPSVKHLEGRHLTATDKRIILECIEFLRGKDNYEIMLGRKGSPKRYCLCTDPEIPNRYAVAIEESYRTDSGRRDTRTSSHVVEVRGVDPLPHIQLADQQLELF